MSWIVLGYRQEIEALTKVYRKLLESHTLNGPVPAATTQLPSMQSNTVKGEVSHNVTTQTSPDEPLGLYVPK